MFHWTQCLVLTGKLAIIISAGRVRVSPAGSGLAFQILTGFWLSLRRHYTVLGTGPCIILDGSSPGHSRTFPGSEILDP